MAATPFLLLAFLLLSGSSFFSVSNASLVLPIVKDNRKSQYFTTFLIGTPPSTRINYVIDLGNKWSWFTCGIAGYYNSSTSHPVPCNTPKCKSYGQFGCIDCIEPPPPGCYSKCAALAYSPWSGLYSDYLTEDVITLYRVLPSNSPSALQLSETSLPDFPFTCAYKGPLKGMSPYTKGIVTLARLPVALHSRISYAFKVPRKFALCLPASSTSMFGNNGAMYFGGGPYPGINASKLLVTTPFAVNPNSTSPIYGEGEPSVEYFINVSSIKVDGIPVRGFNKSLLVFDKDGVGGTKISTTEPYTVLHTEIYKALRNLFVGKAIASKIREVDPVAPFGACFNGTVFLGSTKMGPAVPIIDLVLEGKSPVLHDKSARWRIYGANSMVKVGKDVWCLGFVDGGSSPRTSVVIGGKQMEDNLVEFDLEGNKLGVTSSLLRVGRSCSRFKGI